MNQRLLGQTADVRGVIDSLNRSEQMRDAVPAVMDLSRESKAMLEMYGRRFTNTKRTMDGIP